MDGESALELIQMENEKGVPFHLILLDWKMPGIDGFETAEKIRKYIGENSSPDKIIMIMVTAYEHDLSEKLEDKQNFNFILSKPITPSILFDSIVNVQYPISSDANSQLNDEYKYNINGNINGKKILLVEDNDVNRLVAKETLQKFGLIVDTALNGKEAVEKIQDTTYDAILMDIQMPIMDGYRATIEIRKLFSKEQLPIIALTADAMDSHRENCFAVGMNDHLAKPINAEILFNTLCKWLEVNLSMPEIKPSEEDISQLVRSNINGLDIKAAAERINYDWNILQAALKTFRDNYEKGDLVLNELIAAKQTEKTLTYLHEMIGSAGYIGAMSLIEKAKVFRDKLTEDNFKDIEQCLEPLNSELNNVIELISKVDSSYMINDPDTDNYKQDVKSILSDALDIMNSYRLIPEEMLSDIYNILRRYPIIFEKLESEINNFDYAKAAETIKKAAKQLGVDLEK
jgi:two-component system sensor histidine kinase/response regulator